MDLFWVLFEKIMPLYFSILLGFIAGRFLDIQRNDIARLVFYILTPFIVFNGVVSTQLNAAVLSVPLVTFAVSTIGGYIAYSFANHIWKDQTKNIVAFSAGSGNTGYFGLPIALLLLDDAGEGIYILALLGLTLYEFSIGYYLCSRGRYQPRDAVYRVLTLPIIHALFIGILLNVLNVKMGSMFDDFMLQVKGAFSILGMMILGLALSTLKHFKIDWAFIGVTFFSKFICWPLLVGAFIALDFHFFSLFSIEIYRALLLISIVPLSVNTVIIATLFDNHPDKVATSVVLSTVLALFYAPMMVSFFYPGF